MIFMKVAMSGSNYSNIRVLDMSSSSLNTVPVALLQFELLLSLNLENNELRSIPNLDSLVNLVGFNTKTFNNFSYRNGLTSPTIRFKVYHLVCL